jgi:hypothetical protein
MRRPYEVLMIAMVLLGACARQAGADRAATANDAAAASTAAPAEASGTETVKLTAEAVDKLGIQTDIAKPADFIQEVAGYGSIVGHDTVAQAASELDTAQATAKLSESALARARRLDATPGAMSADAVDALAQKAVVDASALRLTRAKLTALYGMTPPWSKPQGSALLDQVADGRRKLLRAVFPLGALSGESPKYLRVRHLFANAAQNDWKLEQVWDAPADSTAPGRSFFALVKSPDAQEGERLQVWAPIGQAASGVVVPKAAAVMADGKFWCYLEKPVNTFTRVELDPQRISGDGYFIEEGVEPGDRIVTEAAGQLLAKETGTDEAAD